MKKFTLLLSVFCFSQVIYGEGEYHKFAGKGALWNTITVGAMSNPSEWQSIHTLGDTIEINGLKYLEVKDITRWPNNTIGGLREDTLTKKIYYMNDIEVVLYDFSLTKGDTIFYGEHFGDAESAYYKVVDSIGTIVLNGELRKTWYLSTSGYYMPDIWIEGIGSVFRYGLLNPLDPRIPLNGSTTYFGCFKYGDILYFNREATNAYDCPCSRWIVDVPEVESESDEIKLYPIPTNDRLNIDLGNTSYDYLEVYSCNSKLIIKSMINLEQHLELNLENLEKGIYFIKFSGGDNVCLRKFVII